MRRVEVGNEVGTRKRFQGSDWQGPPMSKCSSLFLSLSCSQTAVQCWRSGALLSEGCCGPAGPRKNPRENPVLLVPSDRFVQAPQGNVKSKRNLKRTLKTHSKTKSMKKKKGFSIYTSVSSLKKNVNLQIQ